jgi:hypothetical protein
VSQCQLAKAVGRADQPNRQRTAPHQRRHGHGGRAAEPLHHGHGYPAAALTESGSLPGGLSFTDNGNGTADLAGAPAAGSGGSYSFTVTATNTTGSVSRAFTLKVKQPPASPAPARPSPPPSPRSLSASPLWASPRQESRSQSPLLRFSGWCLLRAETDQAGIRCWARMSGHCLHRAFIYPTGQDAERGELLQRDLATRQACPENERSSTSWDHTFLTQGGASGLRSAGRGAAGCMLKSIALDPGISRISREQRESGVFLFMERPGNAPAKRKCQEPPSGCAA